MLAARIRNPRGARRYQATSASPAPRPDPGVLHSTYVGQRIPVQENYRTHYGRALDLTRIDYALRSAACGYMRPITDISRETVSIDGHLSALLQKRFNRVAALDYTIEPARGEGVDEGRSEEYAAFVRHQVEQIPNLRERFIDLAWGTFDGRAASEIAWRADGRYLRAEDLWWIHPRRLSFGPNRDLRVVDAARDGGGFQPGLGFPLEQAPYKFVIHKPRIFGDYQEREGLAPRCLYWSFFVRFGTRERMALLELFGKPWRVIMPKADAAGYHNAESFREAFDAVNALGAQSTARLPPGMEVMIAQPSKGAGEVHDQAIDHAMKVLSKLILGSTGTTDAVSTGLGSSIGDAHVSEEDLLIASDARRLGEAIETGLTDAIVAVNFGPAALTHAPRFLFRTDPPLNRDEEGARISQALSLGMDVSLEEAREKLGFRETKPDEPVLRRVQRPAALGAAAPAPAPEIVYPIGSTPSPGEIVDAPFLGLPEPGNDNGAPPPALPPPPSGDGGAEPPGGGPPPLPPGTGTPPDETALAADSGPDEAVAALAEKMTRLGITHCEHGCRNRCRICGIERVRDVELGDDGSPVWAVQWRPIPQAPTAAAAPPVAASARASGGAAVDPAATDAELDSVIAYFDELHQPGPCLFHGGAHSESIRLAAQPETVFGSPDTLVTRGIKETAKATEALADAIIEAVSGKRSARAIREAINGAAARFDDRKLAEPIESELLQGGMLGALDADFEAAEGTAIKPEAFAAWQTATLLAGPPRDKRFAARPLKEAIKEFLKRESVTRDVFDSMEEAAQRRAFTVARAANAEMVRTVKRELVRQIALGADFADFGKNAAARFMSAGWIPANPSHVETIFRTNVLNAYNGGRVRQMSQPVVMAARPYWQILTVNDGPPRQRQTHQAAHGLVLTADDAFWKRATPPFGYNCRCRIRSLSARQAASLRIVGGSSVSGLPDPGFTSGTASLL